MISVYRIPVSKDKLLALSKDERILLLLSGHLHNELTVISKLLLLCSTVPSQHEVERKTIRSQQMLLVRTLIGKLYEGWRLIDTRLLKKKISDDILLLLDQEGVEALEKIRAYFKDNKNKINRIRNSHAFHNPTDEVVEKTFQQTGDQNDWAFYVTNQRMQSCYYAADMVFNLSFVAPLCPEDTDKAMDMLMEEVLTVAGHFNDFTDSFIGVFSQKRLGVDEAHEIAQIEDAPTLGPYTLPFYVNVPESPPWE
ncbi:MAG: hypothetical protein JWL84_1211 [Rhodospirillales bacterium]|nr:hypothetical protein [Rhodospirillales bacterium]